MECEVNYDNIRRGIIKKAQELMDGGMSIEEVNNRFGEPLVKPAFTEEEAIDGFQGKLFEGGITNWTNIIQNTEATPDEKKAALQELKEQMSDKNSEVENIS